jgi:hypothetical protein
LALADGTTYRQICEKSENQFTHRRPLEMWFERDGLELALSTSTVQRILAQAQLKPHRLKRYMASHDPDFEPKRLTSSVCT